MSADSLAWNVHPFRRRRALGTFVLAGIAGCSVLAAIWGGAWFWGAFSFAVLFLSLESFYFPTRFVLEEERLLVIKPFSRSERSWTVFRRCMVDERGITLSPFGKSTWLEAYRAIRLWFGSENREEVLQFLRDRLGADVEWTQDRKWERKKKEA